MKFWGQSQFEEVIKCETLTKEKQRLVVALLINEQTPLDVKRRYLMSHTFEETLKNQIIRYLSNDDIFSLFKKYSDIFGETSSCRDFVNLISSLPQERTASLVHDLIKQYQSTEELSICFTYSNLRLFLSTLPILVSAQFHLAIKPRDIPKLLWTNGATITVEDVIHSTQMMALLTYLPADTLAQLISKVPIELQQALLVTRFGLETGAIDPIKTLEPSDELCHSLLSIQQQTETDTGSFENITLDEIEPEITTDINIPPVSIEIPTPTLADRIWQCRGSHLSIRNIVNALKNSDKRSMELILRYSLDDQAFEPLTSLIHGKAKCVTSHSDLIIECCSDRLLDLSNELLQTFLLLTTDESLLTLLVRIPYKQLMSLLETEKSPLLTHTIPRFLSSQLTVHVKAKIICIFNDKDTSLIFFLLKKLPQNAISDLYNLFETPVQKQMLQNLLPQNPKNDLVAFVKLVSTFLCSSFKPTLKKMFILEIEDKDRTLTEYLAQHLPRFALTDFFDPLDEGFQTQILQRLLPNKPSRDLALFTATVDRYLSSTVAPSVKIKLLEVIPTTPLLLHLVKKLPRSTRFELLSLIDKQRHKEILVGLITFDPVKNVTAFALVLNLLPCTSIELLNKEFSQLPASITLLQHDQLTAIPKCQITTWMKPREVETLLRVVPDLINRLEPKVVMQLNRKLNFKQWKHISESINDTDLHLWVDFLSLMQMTTWKLKTNRKREIALLHEFDSARCIDFLTHIDLQEVAINLLHESPERAALFIKKICLHSYCLTLLILITKVENNDAKLMGIFEHFTFIQIKQEKWADQRKQLLLALKELSLLPTDEDCEDRKRNSKIASKIIASQQDFKFEDTKLELTLKIHRERLQAKRELYEKQNVDIRNCRAVHQFTSERRKQRQLPYKFYSDLTGLYPTLAEPIQPATKKEITTMTGSFKKLVCADSQNLSFRAVDTIFLEGMTKRDFVIQRQLLSQLLNDVKEKNGRHFKVLVLAY